MQTDEWVDGRTQRVKQAVLHQTVHLHAPVLTARASHPWLSAHLAVAQALLARWLTQSSVAVHWQAEGSLKLP